MYRRLSIFFTITPQHAPSGHSWSVFCGRQKDDAAMLRNEMDQDRDAGPLLEGLGIRHFMPHVVECGQQQLSIEYANASRLVTTTRWIVEARNGHIKSIFKFFEHLIAIHYIDHLGDFYRIAEALINRCHPLIEMKGCNADLENAMLTKANEVNVVKARVEHFGLRNRHAGWVRLDSAEVADFPHLDLRYLKEITCAVYQTHLPPSYFQDKLHWDDTNEFQIDQLNVEPGFLRARVYLKFRNATKYHIWIAYAAA
ncbi:hypothetical protein FQR65_LT11927 [Abscondita terminalis]|nr:hypothetical protein FQR65_LT11927 [Abscondita terminalis]